MSQGRKDTSSTTRVDASAAFSEAEYAADAGKVIAHAALTGNAVVARADGSPRVVISIPTVDLPNLGD
jgi:hypothetical protein